MLTIAVSRARRSTKSTVAELSMTGEVSGWQMMVVMPPAAAAWLAEAKVSRWLAPGSPTKARMSIRPGATTLPAQLMMSVPSGTPAAPMPRLESRITPSAISTSPGPSKSRDGSMTRALASRIGRRSVSMIVTRSAGCGRALPAPPCAPPLPFRPVPGSATARRRRRCESISTPRFIGPGCITSASGLA